LCVSKTLKFAFPDLQYSLTNFLFAASKYINAHISLYFSFGKNRKFFSCNIKIYQLDMYYFHWACPELDGYDVWTTGGCDDKDELGVITDNLTAETCQALCDGDATCVSFELQKEEGARICRLSTSCFYEDTNKSSSSNWCYYEKSNNFKKSNNVIKKYYRVRLRPSKECLSITQKIMWQ